MPNSPAVIRVGTCAEHTVPAERTFQLDEAVLAELAAQLDEIEGLWRTGGDRRMRRRRRPLRVTELPGSGVV
jgi:hypothetical protein